MKKRNLVITAILLVLCLCLLGNQGGVAAAAEQITIWTTSLQYDLEITEPTLEELPDGTGRFTAKTACRESVVGETVKVAVAFYNTDGKMLDCWMGTHTLAAEGTLTVEGDLPEYDTVGVYFFDSESLIPIRPSVLRMLDGQVQVTAADLAALKGELEERLTALEEEVEQLGAEDGLDWSEADYLMQIFEKIVCIGDSLTAGFTNKGGTTIGSNAARKDGNNWPIYLGLRLGREVVNMGYGSTTTHSWRYADDNLGADIENVKIADADCYIIGLGFNDSNKVSLGSEADIHADDPDQNADTFYGNYDYILRTLLSVNDRSHIFMLTMPAPKENSAFNHAIRALAARYPDRVHLIDLAKDYGQLYREGIIAETFNGHGYPLTYQLMSVYIQKAIGAYMYEHYDLFYSAPGLSGDDGVKHGRDGADGKDGVDGVTPRIRINPETYEWEVSYDGGVVWESLGTNAGEESSGSWAGKSVVFVGDSITAGTGTTKTYCEYLEKSMGFGSVTVLGVPGSCMSTTSDYGTTKSPLINRWQTIPDADLIVVFMGTNDYGHDTPLGSITDTGDVSFYGALNTIVPGILNAHPHSRVVFMTPLHRYNVGKSQITGATHTYDYLPNGRGHTLNDYVNALKEVCQRWSIPVIDLFAESGINPAISAQKQAYMPDGIHPNAAGHEKISYYIQNCLELYGTPEAPMELPQEPETPEVPDDPVDTKLRYGNKFVSDKYAQDRTRASSVTNLWLTAGQTVTLLDPENYQWALAGTNSATSSTKTHGYYPESQWSSIPSYTIQSGGYYGITLLRVDGTEFSFEDGTESDDLFDYIKVD